MLEQVAVCCPMDRVAARVCERCGALADRVSLLAHGSNDPETWAEAARELQSGRDDRVGDLPTERAR